MEKEKFCGEVVAAVSAEVQAHRGSSPVRLRGVYVYMRVPKTADAIGYERRRQDWGIGTEKRTLSATKVDNGRWTENPLQDVGRERDVGIR